MISSESSTVPVTWMRVSCLKTSGQRNKIPGRQDCCDQEHQSERPTIPSLLPTSSLVPQLTHTYLSFIGWPLQVLAVTSDRGLLGIGDGVFSRSEASSPLQNSGTPPPDNPCLVQTSLSQWNWGPPVHNPFPHLAVQCSCSLPRTSSLCPLLSGTHQLYSPCVCNGALAVRLRHPNQGLQCGHVVVVGRRLNPHLGKSRD